MIWNKFGPLLLLGAFLALILKHVPSFLLPALTAFAGYFMILLWKKAGFYLSLAALAAVLFFAPEISVLWKSVFSTCVVLSWLLIFLSQQEDDSFVSTYVTECEELKQSQAMLEKELSALKLSTAQENRENIAEKQRLNQLYVQAMRELSQSKLYLEVAEKEKDKLHVEYEALQHALDATKAQILPVSNVIPQEEENPEEKEQIQRQYDLLREQFDEKSEALDKTREQLFRIENELLALQKTQEERGLEGSDEDRLLLSDLKKLEEERFDLEAQVVNLQELISALLSSKKRTVRTRKSSANQERLPLLIQEKIDQNSSVDQTT